MNLIAGDAELKGRIISRFWGILVKTFKEGFRLDLTQSAAAISFYALFSAAPLLLLSVYFLSLWLDEESVRNFLKSEVVFFGQLNSQLIDFNFLDRIFPQSVKNVSVTFGFAGFLIGAGFVFYSFLDAMRKIWRFSASPHGLAWWIQGLIFSACMVVFFIFSVFFRVVLEKLPKIGELEAFWWRLFDYFFFASLLCLVLGFNFRIFSQRKLSWLCAYANAAAISFLFILGKDLVSWFLSRSYLMGAYGIAGSLVLFLFWIYYSVQIFLWGGLLVRIIFVDKK